MPERRARLVAACASIVVHAVLVWFAWTPRPPSRPVSALQVVYIQAAAPVTQSGQRLPVPDVVPDAAPGAAAAARRGPQARRAPGNSEAPGPASRTVASKVPEPAPAPAAAVTTPDHGGTAAPAPLTAGRPPGLATTLPGESIRFRSGDAFEPATADDLDAERHVRVAFKPVITPEKVVREVARGLGLWPPGYTDSPCPIIHKTLEQVRSRAYVASPEEVDAILKAQALHCS